MKRRSPKSIKQHYVSKKSLNKQLDQMRRNKPIPSGLGGDEKGPWCPCAKINYGMGWDAAVVEVMKWLGRTRYL